jgi:hypothetical protein
MRLTDLDTRRFEELVADALEHLWDYSYLGTHPLVELDGLREYAHPTGKWSHVDQGRMLSEMLRNSIETLNSSNPQFGLSREKHYYSILHKAYVEVVPNKMIAKELNIGERTLYRYSAKAIQVVAKILRDWESSPS